MFILILKINLKLQKVDVLKTEESKRTSIKKRSSLRKSKRNS